jgi:hypothetical protein
MGEDPAVWWSMERGFLDQWIVNLPRGATSAVVPRSTLLEMVEAINRSERLQKERRWIPVEERLPPERELVLVNHADTGIEMAARQPDGGWVICWTGFITGGVAYTHWMPLPEPPEVK